MSNSEVLTPILLRSSTPAPSEKVLLYLEGIARSGGASPVRDSVITDNGPPLDLHSWDPTDPRLTKLGSHSGSRPLSHRAPSNRAPSAHALSHREPSQQPKTPHDGDGGDLDALGNSELSYEEIGYDEVASNVQEGMRSEIAKSEKSAPIHTTGFDHEPGPNDGPRPKYESYGSSFGNLGPPRESIFGPPPPNQPANHWMTTGTPSRAMNVALPPDSEWMSPRSAARSHLYPQPPKSRASVMSPKTADVDIAVEAPSDPSQAPTQYSRAPSRHSHRSSGTAKQPDAPQQPQGITVTINPDGGTTINIPSPVKPPPQPVIEKKPVDTIGDPPFSPTKSRARSRSRAGTDKPPASVAGTRYPTLPSSRGADTETNPASLLSPEMQSRPFKTGPKAPSKAPSNAASRVRSMSPPNAFNTWGEFQSFDFGAPPPKAPSAKAPSQRPAPSEAGTIPNAAEPGHHEFGDQGRGVGEFNGLGDRPRGGASAFGDRSDNGRGQSAFGGNRSEHGNGADRFGEGNFGDAGRFAGPSGNGFAKTGPSQGAPSARHNRIPSGDGSRASRSRALSPTKSHNYPHLQRGNQLKNDSAPTPTQSRPYSPDELNDYETEIVQDILSSRTPRTSIAPSALEAALRKSHFHDQDLCILLHAAEDDMAHEVVRKAVRKAVAARIKKLGMKFDNESIKQYRKNFHNHDPSWHENNRPGFNPDDPPAWAKEMMDQLSHMEERVAALGPQIERLKSSEGSRTRSQSHNGRERGMGHDRNGSEVSDETERTPRTRTVPIDTQMTGDESMFRPPETVYTIPGESMAGPTTIPGSLHHHDGSTHGRTEHDEFEDDDETHMPNGYGEYRPRKGRDLLSSLGRGESPGQQVLEEELYRLRVRQPSQSAMTHRSWEIARESVDGDRETRGPESEMPEIDASAANGFEEHRTESPPLPPIPTESRDVVETQSNNQQAWQPDYQEAPPTPPWQRIHQRLLNWAIVWPVSELDNALNSTLRGGQVDEVALSIWSTQMYKRYVRQQLTEVPPGRVDRLFVPPNMADAINNAVFHGRHGDACGMLRDLWTPFGLEGMPRIIVVLCKHRSDPSHWVAHKFSLPDGTLTTYDTYPEKCLPDGRPLGWWFAIRIAWPGAMYPSPDHLMQKMVRLHRPMQLAIDNSVAAAGIWRNLLMGSRAERPVDLERLRDLINTEVKNLRQRKEQGKLSVAAAIRPNWNWEEMGG